MWIRSTSEAAHVTGLDMLLGSCDIDKLNKIKNKSVCPFFCIYKMRIGRAEKIKVHQSSAFV